MSFLTLIIPLAQPSVSDGPIKVDLVHEKSKRRASLGWSVRRPGGRLAATPPSPARPPASSGLAGGAVTRGGAAHVTRREVHLLNFTGGRGPARQAPPLPRAGWRLSLFFGRVTRALAGTISQFERMLMAVSGALGGAGRRAEHGGLRAGLGFKMMCHKGISS